MLKRIEHMELDFIMHVETSDNLIYATDVYSGERGPGKQVPDVSAREVGDCKNSKWLTGRRFQSRITSKSVMNGINRSD